MIRVPVQDLQLGQMLAQDVTRQDGMVLMPKGQEVTAEIKSLLTRMEVDAVVVEGDLFASEEERQAFLAEQEKELYRRFSRVENDPLLMGLRELYRRRLYMGCYPRPRPQPKPPAAPPKEEGPPVIYSKKDRAKP
jgi:coenzyme F420-reducing hydrogenase beta subunit